MSLVAVGDGFLVLDQVNDRVVRWTMDGKASVLGKIKVTQAADIAAGSDGSLAILDRLVDKKIALFDKDGKALGELPLDRERVGDLGAVTGVFVDGDEVLVEREHGALVRVGTTRGEPLESGEQMPGRPSRDGKLLLSAGIVNRKQGRVFVSAFDRAAGEARFTRQLSYAGMIASVVALDSDRTGTIYLAVAIDQGSASPTMVTCLEPTRGAPLGTVELPTNDSPEETLKEITVTDDGQIVFAHRLPEGMAFEAYRCP